MLNLPVSGGLCYRSMKVFTTYSLSSFYKVGAMFQHIHTNFRTKNTSVHVGFKVLTAVVIKGSIFWDVMPRSPLKVECCFRGHFISTCFMLVTCLDYSSALGMEATCSSKTSVDFQLTTWRILED
jgi:hypothetical protein